MPKAIPVFVEKVQDRRRNSNQVVIKADDRSGHGARGARSQDPLLPKIPTAAGGHATAITPRPELIAPWLSAITKRPYSTVVERLHDEIVAFASWVSPTPTEDKATQSIVTFVSNSLAAHYHEQETVVSVKVFGSVDSGLSFPDSDLNLEFYCEHEAPSQPRTRIRAIHNIMVKAGLTPRRRGVCVQSTTSDGIRFPSVQFSLLPDLGSRSITLTRVNGPAEHVGSTGEVKALLARHLALKPLFLVLKSFLCQRFLHGGENGLTSYALVKLCARFLESNPCDRPKRDLEQPLESRSLGSLLFDFFYYFGFYNIEAVSEAQAVRYFFEEGPVRQAPVGARTDIREQIKRCFQHTWMSLNAATTHDHNLLGPVVAITHQTVNHRVNIIELVYSERLVKLPNSAFRRSRKKAGSTKSCPLPPRSVLLDSAGEENRGMRAWPQEYQQKETGLSGPGPSRSGGRRQRGWKYGHVKEANAAADSIYLQFGRLGI